MAQILDMVPNHVGVMGQENGWWLDVLENGRASPYASYFDIDWEPLRQELRGKVLVPVLGDYYGNVLDSGALRLVFSEGAFRAEYYEHHFPIDPREYPRILAPGLERLRKRLSESDGQLAAGHSAREPAQCLEVGALVGHDAGPLGEPQRLAEAFHHPVLRLVRAVGGRQAPVDGGDARGPVRRDLFPQRQVHPHVEKGVDGAAVGDPLAQQRVLALFDQSRVLRMLQDHVRDLRLQRFQRASRAVPCPRLGVHAPQTLAIVGEEHGRSPYFTGSAAGSLAVRPGYSQRSAMMQRSHSGRRALHT
jgi:hypothetical protein